MGGSKAVNISLCLRNRRQPRQLINAAGGQRGISNKKCKMPALESYARQDTFCFIINVMRSFSKVKPEKMVSLVAMWKMN